MGYGIMPYRVSLSRLATRFGNPNSAKRSKARRACAPDASQMDDIFDYEAPLFMDIVEELLAGKATHANAGAKYWYAIKGLCEHLGRFMSNSEWYPSPCDAFWDHPDFKMYDIDAPMEIPQPDDFPTVLVLRQAKMTDELIEGLSQYIEDKAQLAQARNWVGLARRYKQDLVLYYH